MTSLFQHLPSAKLLGLAAAMAAALAAGPVHAQPAPQATPPVPQTTPWAPPNDWFVQQAINGGTFEVESSKVALKTSQNPAVRQYAQYMINDHTEAKAELLKLVSVLPQTLPGNIQLPGTDAFIDAPHAGRIQQLRESDPASFDQLYIRMQVTAHEDTINLFENFAKYGADKDLQAYADRTLPTLRNHYDQVRQIQGQLQAPPPPPQPGPQTSPQGSPAPQQTPPQGSSPPANTQPPAPR